MANRSLFNFFQGQLVGFIICVARMPTKFSDIRNLNDVYSFLDNLFLFFILCNFISFWIALPNMMGIDLYLYIKKNLKNEERIYLWGGVFWCR